MASARSDGVEAFAGMQEDYTVIDPPAADERDDSQLVAAALDGNRSAFGRLYQRYARMVHGILLARVPLRDVDDLVHDAFLQALRRLCGENISFSPRFPPRPQRLRGESLSATPTRPQPTERIPPPLQRPQVLTLLLSAPRRLCGDDFFPPCPQRLRAESPTATPTRARTSPASESINAGESFNPGTIR